MSKYCDANRFTILDIVSKKKKKVEENKKKEKYHTTYIYNFERRAV